MPFPQELRFLLDRELAKCSMQELQKASERMSEYYRGGKNSAALFQNPLACLAYLATRMPATFAAIEAVLLECAQRLPFWSPRTAVDIGAGPGTGGFAMIEQFPSIETILFIEKNAGMRAIGQRLNKESSSPVLQQAIWKDSLDTPKTDVALLSYLVGEMTGPERDELLYKLWSADIPVIVVIEPGTPQGFQRILEIRKKALNWGAEIVAPCTHRKECPMESRGWCHFPARVERSRLHIAMKRGSLGFEDEKFSYLVFGKISAQPAQGRIVDNPKKNSGFVQIPLCSDGRLEERIVSRKQDQYRAARKASYGDAWL